MDGEFKIYRELDLKKCKVLRYSTMGQYLSCVDQKEISIYYSYSLEKPQKMQSPSQNVTNLCFNHNDTIISVVSSDGFVQKYELTHFKKTGDSTIDKACNFNKCMFSRVQEADGQYLEKLYIVGHEQQHQCQLIRCYGKKDKDELEEDFKPENFYNGTKAFTSIVEVVPSKSENLSFVDQQKKARNIVLSTNDGKLMIYGTKPNLRPDRECSMMYTHCGQINVMMVSEDNKTMFTGGKDGTIFVYKVTESQNNKIGEYSRKFADHLYDLRKESQAHKEQQMQKTQKKKEIEEKNNSSIDSKDASLNRTFGDKKDEEAGGGGNLKKREDEGSESEGSDLDPEEIQRFRRVNRDMYHDIDTKLSGIVLIEKQLMDDWRKQQEQLKLDLEKEENAFESKIRRERYHQDTEVAKMEKKKSEQLNNINKEYNDLQAQETEEKDENTQAMKKMQLNHLQCMEELQQLYEKKLQMEQKQYNDLLALKKQIEANYEQELFDLQKQNEVATEKLLQEYKNNFHEVQELYDNAKRQADGLKMIQEEIQNQTEFENDLYIKELKDVFELEIKEKSDVILTIKNDIDSIKRQQKRETEEKEKYQRIKEIAESKKKTRDKLIEEKDRMIIELEEEKKQIQNQLRQKESELFKYKFKIKELDKTKAVLTHRTQEMKASLEPKEQQIENLKEKLLELEEGFQHQSKAINTLEGDVQKKEEKINEMELKLTKEKFKTKSKEQIINNFVNDVHKAYKTKNDEEYIKGLMSIYNMYVRQHTDEILENKKKDPETIEELDRQLQYMEKSIAILKKTTNSNQAKTKLNINKRRQENGQLIKGLDDVRKSKSNYQSELEKKTLTIQKLKLDKQKIQREFQKKLSQIEAETLQRVKAAGVLNQAGKEKIDSQFEQDTIYNKGSKQDEEFFSNEPGVPSKVKGKIFKGTTFTRGNKEDKNKIQDLQTQLEESNQQILMYKMEKKTLQENLIRILDERANDLGLTEEERREQLNKLNVIALNSEQDDQTFFNI